MRIGEAKWVEHHRDAGEAAAEVVKSLDRRPRHEGGAWPTAGGLYGRVGDYGRRLGPRLAHHKLRHSTITAVLEVGAGLRYVQQLSRHAKLETLVRYDNSLDDKQGKVSRMLSNLL